MGKHPDKFCILPFISTSIGTNGLVRPCCEYPTEKAFGSMHENSLNEILNGEKAQQLKAEMNSGLGSANCQYCYDIEATGNESKRTLNLKKYSLPKNADETIIKYLDIRFSNQCNFACRTCMPSASTSWYQDATILSRGKFIDPGVVKPTKVDQELFDQLDQHVHTLEEVYFAGGEPLQESNHYEFLDKLLEKERTDIRLLYTTNFSSLRFKTKKVTDYWNQFKTVNVNLSLDDFGIRGEYIRKGLKYKTFVENLKTLRKESPHVKVSIATAVSLLNVFSLPDFLLHLSEELQFKSNQVTLDFVFDPDLYSIRVLPAALKDQLKAKYQTAVIPENFRYHLDKVISYLDLEDHSFLWNKFISYTKALDQIRSESILDFIPDYKEAFSEKK
ncbi:MAG: hypothetical protein COW00_02185 [Bdellovibrio sp. CG12_big_fil_rev_8_21_14_0_65_39_13]|nr:MAG: hypothetical protein COW00_02185 [Bdellovibrio sp. CG12_big_fil_rev_8_21_14_0_65_39_13]PIR34201.1 MAG: hypothetical protein COV37_13930 [Bdellovibrio sp. CG11_big_fil_rev_8_21_14_0_20_39_38]